jgi:HSP20 family protein
MTVSFRATLQKPDHFEMTADIPGFKKEEVKVEIHDDVLRVTAEHSEEKQTEHEREADGGKWLRVERRYGSLYRQIKLPPSANLAAVEAKADNGVLTVTIGKKPVSPADMPKSIPVA